MEHSRPLWVSYLNVKFYWLVALVVLVVQIVCIVLMLKFHLLTTNYPSQRDLFINSDIRTMKLDTFQEFQQYMHDYMQKLATITTNSTGKDRSEVDSNNCLQVIYKCKRQCKTLFTAKNIRKMENFAR